MADSIQKRNLMRWFTSLHAFQDDCASFNTSVVTMDLLTFANTTVTAVMPSTNEQGQFLLAAAASPGFDISSDDLSTFSTFEALLDHFSPLPTFVAAYIQMAAANPFPSGSLSDFLSAPVTSAFPGGSGGSNWQTALNLLTSVIPSVCFSATLQAAAATTVDDVTKKVSDAVNQIAKLG
jgi:hypothetical protein